MKKWLIGISIAGTLVTVLLLGVLAVGAFARVSTQSGTAAITEEEAKAAALEAYPRATVVEVELERENGTLVYEVELDNGLEVAVDANNGSVLSPEMEGAGAAGDDAEDADEWEDDDDVDDADHAEDDDDADHADDD